MLRILTVVLAIFLCGSASFKVKNISPEELIKPLEGLRLKAYHDVNGYAICFGNHYWADGSKVRKGEIATRERCNEAIKAHVGHNDTYLKSFSSSNFYKRLFPSQKSAIHSYVYRHGIRGSRKLLDCLDAGDFDCVGDMIKKQEDVPNRAKIEYKHWVEWYAKN